VHVDAALNLAWALLSVGALLFHWWRDRSSTASHSIRVRRAFTVFVALVALFPCISASDDEVRLNDLHRQINPHTAFDRTRPENLPLSIQLEDLEHAQIAAPFTLVLVLCFVLMVGLELRLRAAFRHRDSLSRAPPLAV